MITLKLHDGLSLLIEPDNKKLRLVITDGTTELACRKETPGKLNRFLSSEDNSLFKGRLQLHKSGDIIGMVLKEKHIGSVTIDGFKKALGTFK